MNGYRNRTAKVPRNERGSDFSQKKVIQTPHHQTDEQRLERKLKKWKMKQKSR